MDQAEDRAVDHSVVLEMEVLMEGGHHREVNVRRHHHHLAVFRHQAVDQEEVSAHQGFDLLWSEVVVDYWVLDYRCQPRASAGSGLAQLLLLSKPSGHLAVNQRRQYLHHAKGQAEMAADD